MNNDNERTLMCGSCRVQIVVKSPTQARALGWSLFQIGQHMSSWACAACIKKGSR